MYLFFGPGKLYDSSLFSYKQSPVVFSACKSYAVDYSLLGNRQLLFRAVLVNNPHLLKYFGCTVVAANLTLQI